MEHLGKLVVYVYQQVLIQMPIYESVHSLVGDMRLPNDMRRSPRLQGTSFYDEILRHKTTNGRLPFMAIAR